MWKMVVHSKGTLSGVLCKILIWGEARLHYRGRETNPRPGLRHRGISFPYLADKGVFGNLSRRASIAGSMDDNPHTVPDSLGASRKGVSFETQAAGLEIKARKIQKRHLPFPYREQRQSMGQT